MNEIKNEKNLGENLNRVENLIEIDSELESFKITPRIEQLLVKVAEHNYTSINEMNLFFTSNGHVYKVLRGLMRAKIFSEIKTKMVPSKVYHLTNKGYEYLEQKGLLASVGRFQSSDFRMTTCFHHLTCLAVRIVFESVLNASNWVSEKRLNYTRSGQGIDGVRLIERVTDSEFDIGSIHVGLEVELTLKSPNVFKRNVDNLNLRLRRNDFQNVIWVIRHDNVIDAIRRLCGIREESALAEINEIYASHLFINRDDLISKRGDAYVRGLSGRLKLLKELA